MIKQISTVYPLGNYQLLIWFQGGEARLLDCAHALSPADFKRIKGARTFPQARITANGYALSWEEKLDLTSKELLALSTPAPVQESECSRIAAQVAQARKQHGFSQAQLEGATGVRQPVIARIETGASNPRLDTLLKVLAPLGKTLQVTDIAPAAR